MLTMSWHNVDGYTYGRHLKSENKLPDLEAPLFFLHKNEVLLSIFSQIVNALNISNIRNYQFLLSFQNDWTHKQCFWKPSRENSTSNFIQIVDVIYFNFYGQTVGISRFFTNFHLLENSVTYKY